MAVSRQSREVAIACFAHKYRLFDLPMRNCHCEAFCVSDIRRAPTQNVEAERGNDLVAIGSEFGCRRKRGRSRYDFLFSHDSSKLSLSSIDTTRLPNSEPAPQNTTSEASTDFPFINISNPSQSSDPSTQTLVRKAVQRRRRNRGASSGSEGRYQEPESPGGLAFVNISDPSQNADPSLKRFIRQTVQLRQRQEWARTEAFKRPEQHRPNYASSSNAVILTRRVSEASSFHNRLSFSSST